MSAQRLNEWQTENFTVSLLPFQPYEVSFVSDTPSIGFVFDSQLGVHALGSDQRSDFYAPANSFAYLPAGCDVYSSSWSGGEYLKVVSIEGQRRSELSQKRGELGKCLGEIGQEPRNLSATLNVTRLVHQLRKILLSQVTINHAAIDQIILAWVGEFEAGRDSESGWMTKHKMKMIESYIDQHIEEKLSVNQLAANFGLSPGYFSREFRRAFGQTPHDFVLDRRVCRARNALRGTQNLVDIALKSGFSSHAHMSAVFMNRLGGSPTTLKANH